MFGLGVLKGLGVTLKHFINTFVDDLKYFPKSTLNEEAFARRQGPEGAGLFTVEYPEKKLEPPENFRFIPFLVTDYDLPKDDPEYDLAQAYELNRCTSCGICAKVCPPQCIWIVRATDPKTGKPVSQSAEFYIDTDICMNCGFCAEFCPFDSIKMDHDYELADYEREVGHIHDQARLMKPVSYYASIRPTWSAQEEAARKAAEEEKQRKAEEKKRKAAEKAAAKAAAAKGDEAKPAAKPKKSPEEIKAQRETMPAKKRERTAKAEAAVEPAKSDDLTKIEGIGPKISGILKDAGISTFATLAATKANSLKETLQKAELRVPHDPTTWPEQAKLAAAGKWTELETLQDQLKGGVRVEADDLTKVEGIGPKLSSILKDAGITTFAKLAATEADKLKEILKKSELRIPHDPTTWPEQAQLAAEGKWEELETLQDQLKGGRRV